MGALFPPGAVAAELSVDAPEDARAIARARQLLTDDEWRSIAHCSGTRIRDFTAGRLCAHRALQALDIQCASLLPAPDRQPLWPAGISGSITHTDGYAAAVIGRLAEVGSLGLDCERIEDVAESLWRKICTSAELEQLARWPADRRGHAAALCFVAKEAFYKAQFALYGEPLSFDALRIDLQELARAGIASDGQFQVHPLRVLPLRGRSAWTGRYRIHAGYVSAGIALPARIE